MASPGSFVRAFRIVRVLDRRHGFLVACRVSSAIAWYARGKAILAAQRPDAVVVSSDTNPEEVGFTAAARALAIPSIFISHAYPTPFSPPLAFSLSILGGKAEVEARRRRGPIAGEILLAGLEGDSGPLNARQFERREPVIGIFAPKAVSWNTLAAVIDDCRRHFNARQIVIRWHPSMLELPRLSRRLGDLSGIVESPRTATLSDVARQCDWVIADENSSVHLPVLKLGIPSFAVKQLGVQGFGFRRLFDDVIIDKRIAYPLFSVSGLAEIGLISLVAGVPLLPLAWIKSPRSTVAVSAAYALPGLLFLAFWWPPGAPVNLDLLMAAFPGLFAACWLLASSHERAVSALVAMGLLHVLFWTNIGSTLLHRIWITAPG